MDYETNTSYIEMRSAGMAIASLVMGIIGLVLGCCIYPAIIFGSLAIIFALLSRGGEMNMNGYAKAGLILGIIGIAAGILFFLFSFASLMIQYGGFDGYMNYIYDLMDEMGYPGYDGYYDYYDML